MSNPPPRFDAPGMREVFANLSSYQPQTFRPVDLFGGGVEVITSPYVPREMPTTRLRADWRERLARNLGRPSTGKWESLEETVMVPAFVLVSPGVAAFHPASLAEYFGNVRVAP